MPFTFQITDVFELFCTVAENCRLRLIRTVADVGEIEMPTGADTTSTYKVFDVSPSGVLTTTGSANRGAAALPVAVTRMDETNVVASATPSNDTTDPVVKPTPLTVSVKSPVGTGDGLTDETAGSGRIVTDELPVDVGDVVLAARTVTVAGLGATFGATYRPLASIVPTIVVPPVVSLTLQVTVFGAPDTFAVKV
jgi:hypothetical protein